MFRSLCTYVARVSVTLYTAAKRCKTDLWCVRKSNRIVESAFRLGPFSISTSYAHPDPTTGGADLAGGAYTESEITAKR